MSMISNRAHFAVAVAVAVVALIVPGAALASSSHGRMYAGPGFGCCYFR